MKIKINEFIEKSKKGIVLSIMALFMLMFIFYQFFVIKGRQYTNFNTNNVSLYFLSFALFAMLCVFVSYFYIVKKQIDISNICTIGLIAIGVVYTIMFLPGAVPDERVHFYSSYELSNYFSFNFEQAGTSNLIMRESDVGFVTSTLKHLLNEDYYAEIKNGFSWFSAQNALVEYGGHNTMGGSNAPLGYIFSALGIAIARMFKFSPTLLYFFGRFFNVVSYALMVRWAIKRIPYGKMAIFAISFLPMNLHLMASYSYDAQIVAFVMLFVAQVLYMREKEDNISIKDIIVCSVFAILVGTSKLVYIPLVLLVFIIPKEKFGFSFKKTLLTKVMIFAIAVIFMIITQLGNLLETVTDVEVSWSGEDARSVSWILQNPLHAIKVYVDTIFVRGDFYLDSLVGYSLGFFQITVPGYCYIPFFGFLIYSFMSRSGEKSQICFGNKLWMTLLVIASIMLTLTSMMIAWTPLSYSTIEGVQGRYFIPLLIVVYLILRNKFIAVSPKTDKYAIFVLLYWNLFVGIQYFVTAFA